MQCWNSASRNMKLRRAPVRISFNSGPAFRKFSTWESLGSYARSERRADVQPLTGRIAKDAPFGPDARNRPGPRRTDRLSHSAAGFGLPGKNDVSAMPRRRKIGAQRISNGAARPAAPTTLNRRTWPNNRSPNSRTGRTGTPAMRRFCNTVYLQGSPFSRAAFRPRPSARDMKPQGAAGARFARREFPERFAQGSAVAAKETPNPANSGAAGPMTGGPESCRRKGFRSTDRPVRR